MGRSGPRSLVAVITTMFLTGLAPATPALARGERSDAGGAAASNLVNRFLDLSPVKIGGGYELSGFAYKSLGSFLHLRLDNAPQFHSGDFNGGKGAVRFSKSLRKVAIDMPLDGGYGKVVMSSKVPASAVKERKIEGCSGKRYSVKHELSGILKFKTGSDPFGTIKLRDITAKLTGNSANFQCTPSEPPCPRSQRVMTASGSEFVLDARKSKGNAHVTINKYEAVTPNTAISHLIRAKMPGSAVQLTDDLSSGSVDAIAAEPDLGGEFSFSATAAGTTSPGDCGTTFHYRDGDLSGVGFHAEFDWGGSYYPFVGGPVMGGARRTEVP